MKVRGLFTWIYIICNKLYKMVAEDEKTALILPCTKFKTFRKRSSVSFYVCRWSTCSNTQEAAILLYATVTQHSHETPFSLRFPCHGKQEVVNCYCSFPTPATLVCDSALRLQLKTANINSLWAYQFGRAFCFLFFWCTSISGSGKEGFICRILEYSHA